MNKFNVFDYVDSAIIKTESKEPRASRIPSVWPSEASAKRIDKSLRSIDGKCHRQSYFRMTGTPEGDAVDPVLAWRWITGRQIENHLSLLSKATDPKIYVASGVRHFVEDLYLPMEIDLVVKDPNTNQGWIVECKTYYGYQAGKQITKEGKPKTENLFQALLYLYVVRTGKRLKEIVKENLKLKEAGTEKRLRIDVDLEQLDKIDDGPLGAKLVYIARDECQRTEFDIGFQEYFDGSLYPVINGQMWRTWTVDSILERYKTLQDYWFRARREAKSRLAIKNIHPPTTMSLVLESGDKLVESTDLTAEQIKAEEDYLQQLEQETRRLPDTFWPPAEYEFSYSADKIEKLYAAKEIGRIAYTDWKKKKIGRERIGDWQCNYCQFKKLCVPKQQPNLAHMIYDISNMQIIEEEE